MNEADEKMQDAVAFLEEDLKTYRVGKANPSVLNNVMVDYYGSSTRFRRWLPSARRTLGPLPFSLGTDT